MYLKTIKKRTNEAYTFTNFGNYFEFLLAAVAMEETKKTYARRVYQFKNWKEEKIKNKWKERK